MTKPQFVHLHNHSEYSLFDGMLRFTNNYGGASEFMLELAKQKDAAMAITDHCNMYGAMEFYFTAKKLGIKPIIGCEVYVQRTPIADKSEGSRRGAGHLVLLASGLEGYSNLCRIVSKSVLEGFNHGPKVDLELLAAHSKGLICLSGCKLGQIPRACAQGRTEEALTMAKKHMEIFGKNNFYLELIDDGMPEQAAATKGLLEISKKLELPVVATNDCHYWKAEDWEAQDVKLCIRYGSRIDAPKRYRLSGHEYYFKSPEQMCKLFAHTPEAIKNTLAIAERCNIEIPVKPRFPEFRMKGGTDARLKALCLEAAGKKPTPEHKKRLDYELKEVKAAGFAQYFLIIADIVKQARAQGIPVGPGRGASSGMLINYLLGITRIDPLEYGLFSERFLNSGRQTMPDLDIDFGDSGRAKVMEYVRQKYGANNVANVITYGTLHAKATVRYVGRAMNATLADIAAISIHIPDFQKHLDTVPEIKTHLKNAKRKKIYEIALKLTGQRHLTGVHAAGVFIAPGPAADFVPLTNINSKKAVMTQYDGNTLSKLGFMKVDFLGLRALDIIKAAVGSIKTHGFELEKIPLDDLKTWTLISAGLTDGILQLESEGIKKYLVAAKPGRLEDLGAIVALYRPGPIENKMMDRYIESKNSSEKPAYTHTLLAPILSGTYGVYVYQEQIMAIAIEVGGFTPREADDFRRIMGKKQQPEMDELRKKFIAAARKKKIAATTIEAIFSELSAFAGCGFNKSHSIAYSLISYQQAYLKANYPQEFMTALLENEKKREYSEYYNKYLHEARRIGVKV
ncbi:MAG: DNA polymerase III subunit alpha [Elusimicrobia bacterium]|nr:DNA polymerase III subunit alpha [Elusimicrobiota bacterium]